MTNGSPETRAIADPEPTGRPWWKLHLTTWHFVEITLFCLLYLNFGSALAMQLTNESHYAYAGEKPELRLCGWPIPCWLVDELPASSSPTYALAPADPNEAATETSPRADQVSTSAEHRPDPYPVYLAQFAGGVVGGGGGAAGPPQSILMGPLILDIAAGLLVLAGVAVTVESVRRQYPKLLQITILQCLALTAFAALFLAVVDRRDAAASQFFGTSEPTPAQRVLATLHTACEIYGVGAAVFCVFFLSKPRWWRRGHEV